MKKSHRNYEFNSADMAVLAVIMDEINSLFHDERSIDDYEYFKNKYYEYIHRINYEIIGEKISDKQRELISSSEIYSGVGTDRAIEIYSEILEIDDV